MHVDVTPTQIELECRVFIWSGQEECKKCDVEFTAFTSLSIVLTSVTKFLLGHERECLLMGAALFSLARVLASSANAMLQNMRAEPLPTSRRWLNSTLWEALAWN
jgi:hypothetical protein